MASYRRYGAGWRAEVSKLGIRESATFPTKREAQEWAVNRELEITTSKTGKVTRATLKEVMERYAKDISPSKPGHRWELVRIGAISKDKIAAMVMQDIQAKDLAAWRDRRLEEVKPSSVLRDIGLLLPIWTQARKAEWLYTDNDPWEGVTRPKKGKPRTTIFTQAQVDKIVSALGYTAGQPPKTRQQAAVALLLSLETAMRAGEIVGLTWQHVHPEKRLVHLPETKNGDARDVPLSSRAAELLECMRGVDDVRVFTLTPALLDAYYRQGRTLAGVDGVTFHDARATAITRLSKRLDILELARMVGHRDPRSLMVYYRKSATDIAAKLD